MRDDAGRLGFALQLGTLRYLGFCPDDLAAAPAEVVRFLADQLNRAKGATHGSWVPDRRWASPTPYATNVGGSRNSDFPTLQYGTCTQYL